MNNIEDAFSQDPYIKAIQKEIIAELERRLADGRLVEGREVTSSEWEDVERTAIDNVKAKWTDK